MRWREDYTPCSSPSASGDQIRPLYRDVVLSQASATAAPKNLGKAAAFPASPAPCVTIRSEVAVPEYSPETEGWQQVINRNARRRAQ
uniref:Uncharacterized protein n=1 Tax=Arundo donax TaxID=35708 RepID=A0A0A8ZL61_ARUDO